jgi:hypothetical protein
MKFKFYLDIGLIGCQVEEIKDIPDNEIEGLEGEELELPVPCI